MGVFQDLLYPDNNNRGNRATELAGDIHAMLYTLHTDKAIIDTRIATANKSIAAAYGVAVPGGVSITAVDISTSAAGDWTAYIADLIIPIVSAKAVSGAIDAAFTTYLAESGRIGEAAFAKIIGLPGWMSWTSRLGGAAGAAAAFVVIDIVVSSITGAVQRDKLREMLHDQVTPRHQLQKNTMITAQIKDSLNAAIFAFDSVKDVVTDKASLDTIAKNIVSKHDLHIADITDAVVDTALKNIDAARSSWTDEDTK
jgi:hypothetical protein